MCIRDRACALLNERDYILPEDVQRMVLPVLAHRITPNPEACLLYTSRCV